MARPRIYQVGRLWRAVGLCEFVYYALQSRRTSWLLEPNDIWHSSNLSQSTDPRHLPKTF